MDNPNPLLRVVGLAYEPGEGLPQVILKGAGDVADEIVRAGRRAGVEVVANRPLADQLFRLPLDSAIGPELFEAVALILAHVFAVDRSYQRRQG